MEGGEPAVWLSFRAIFLGDLRGKKPIWFWNIKTVLSGLLEQNCLLVKENPTIRDN